MLVFPLEQHRYYGEAANAGGEEAEEDVGGGDQPEGKDVNHWVAILGGALCCCVWPVDPRKKELPEYLGLNEKSIKTLRCSFTCRPRHSQ